MATRSTSDAGHKRGELVIGWREWARLPDLCETPVQAKIDTGAKTSAIHAVDIFETERAGVPVASFRLDGDGPEADGGIFCEAPVFDRRRIKSSNGLVETRLVVRTTLTLGDRSRSIDLSLANRDDMEFRFLIGRDALSDGILVRPDRSFLLGT